MYFSASLILEKINQNVCFHQHHFFIEMTDREAIIQLATPSIKDSPPDE